MGQPGGGESARSWVAGIVTSMLALDRMGAIALAIDPHTRTTIGSTPTLSRLLGVSMPEQVEDLVSLGIVGRVEFDRVMDHIDTWRALDDIEGHGRETSHSWSDAIQVTPVGAAGRRVHLSIVQHRRPQLGVEVVIATIDTATQASSRRQGPPGVVGSPSSLWTVLDGEMRVIATDPRLADLGVERGTSLGTLASALIHPADHAAALPEVLALVSGATHVHESTVRVAGPGGTWVLAHIKLRRLDTADGALIVAVQRSATEGRERFPLELISASELAVVALLFEGLRPAAIAQRRHVSLNTVRKQLASAFRKLDVRGQSDLISRYNPPRSQ